LPLAVLWRCIYRMRQEPLLSGLRRTLFVPLSLVLVLMLTAADPAVAGPRDPNDYPLLVHIFTEHAHRNRKHHYTTGHGKANLMEGDDIHGMEYDFECDHGFLESEADENYPAKWKKPGLQLELLIGVIGSETKTQTCRLNVAQKEFVYIRRGSNVDSVSLEQYNNLAENKAAAAAMLNPQDVDPSHYPLQVSILKLMWGPVSEGMHYGTGLGNVTANGVVSAVDLSLACPMKIETTPEGRSLRAQWVQPGADLTLLLGGFGSGAATCNIETVVHPDVYVRQGSEVKAVAVEEYRRTHPKADVPQ
jgi:hypothetical protein